MAYNGEGTTHVFRKRGSCFCHIRSFHRLELWPHYPRTPACRQATGSQWCFKIAIGLYQEVAGLNWLRWLRCWIEENSIYFFLLENVYLAWIKALLIVYLPDLWEERVRDETQRAAFVFLGTALLILFILLIHLFVLNHFGPLDWFLSILMSVFRYHKIIIFLVISYVG